MHHYGHFRHRLKFDLHLSRFSGSLPHRALIFRAYYGIHEKFIYDLM